MLPKQGRQKIIKDVHKDQPKSTEEQFERDLQGRRTALVGSNPYTGEQAARSDISHATYMTLKNMTAEQKEEQYQRMGTPTNIKRKRLYFRSIQLFTPCILKYFKPATLFLHGDDEYGGLKAALNSFQDIIYNRLKNDPDLGIHGSQPKL